MPVSRSDARKIIKNHAPTKYSNSAVLLLLKVLDLTYRKDKDDAEREVETTAASLMRSAAVGEKQLRRILDQLSADGVLLDVERCAGRVRCRLNLKPLTHLEPYGEKQKAEKNASDAGRAAKARERRTVLRKMETIVENVGKALAHDTGDLVIKLALLKDVKDTKVRTMMLNWDVERIRRAKHNAEAVMEEARDEQG